MRPIRFHPILCLIAALLLVPAAPVMAQLVEPVSAQLPGAGAPLSDRVDRDLRTGHSWVILADGDLRSCELHHLPPQDTTRKITPASLRPVAAFKSRPDFIAALGERVYLAFGSRIASVRAVRITGPGGWDYLPLNDAISEPPLPEGSVVLGLACAPAGPAALVRSAAGDLELHVLGNDGWLKAALPTLARASTLHLVGSPRGLLLLQQASGAINLWDGRVTIERGADPRPDESARAPGKATIQWTHSGEYTLPPELADADARPLPWRAASVDNTFVLWSRRGADLLIWAAHDGRFVPVQTVPGVPEAFAVVPVSGSGTLRIFWLDHSAAPAARPAAPAPAGDPHPVISPLMVQVREVSVSTGRLLYAGGLNVGGAISRTDFTLLVAALCGAMAAALIFIVRGGPGPPIVLPDGAALAPPGRRFVAWILDFVPAVVLTGAIFNLAPSGVIAGSITGEGASGAVPLLLALAIAAAHSAICEAVWGRSLGKFLMGLDVVAIQRAPAQTDSTPAPPVIRPATGSVNVTTPLVWQAIVRSAVRFLLFPLTGLLLLDPAWRHPGDVLARTVVIERAPEPEEPEE